MVFDGAETAVEFKADAAAAIGDTHAVAAAVAANAAAWSVTHPK